MFPILEDYHKSLQISGFVYWNFIGGLKMRGNTLKDHYPNTKNTDV